MAKWRVFSLDVWGNEKDGYDVNDRRQVGTIDLKYKAFSDDQLLKALVDAGIATMKRSDKNHIFIDGGEDYISIDYKGKPVFQLDKE
jgi:hypothetical protein